MHPLPSWRQAGKSLPAQKLDGYEHIDSDIWIETDKDMPLKVIETDSVQNQAVSGRFSRLWLIFTGILVIGLLISDTPVLVDPTSTRFDWWATPLSWLVTSVIAVAPIIGVIRYRPTHLRIWLVFAASPVVVLTANLMLSYLPSDQFPAPANYLQISSVLLTITFLSFVLRRRSSGSDASGFIDATIIGVAAFLVTWIFVIVPSAHAEELTVAAKGLYIALAVMDLVTVWLCVQMAFDGGHRAKAYRIMTFSFIGSAVMDGFLVAGSFTTAFTPIELTVVNVLRNVLYVLTMTAPLHPSMSLLIKRADTVRHGGDSRLRVGFVTLVSLVTPALLVVEHFQKSRDNLLVIAIGSVAMLLLVVARLEGMIRKQAQTNAALDETLQKLQVADVQLRHAQKLEAVGKLAAGLAHEINTPIQFIGDNVRFLESSFDSMSDMCQAYRRFMPKELEEAQDEQTRSADFEMFGEEVPAAIRDTLSGVSRVANIVSAMKAFGDLDNVKQQLIDVNTSIQNTLVVAHSQIEPFADVVVELQPNIPDLLCHPGDINQILLNVVVNAAHAVRDANRTTDERGKITIKTFLSNGNLGIAVEDNGIGIAEEIRDRIFEPFFTTKDVGDGMGQGLALVWALVVDRHHGSVDVKSGIDGGAVFTLLLPLESETALSI